MTHLSLKCNNVNYYSVNNFGYYIHTRLMLTSYPKDRFHCNELIVVMTYDTELCKLLTKIYYVTSKCQQ